VDNLGVGVFAFYYCLYVLEKGPMLQAECL
jgi:hypothetical protein